MANTGQSNNPYASPQTDSQSVTQAEPRMGIYKPRLAPRDALDVLMGLCIGVPVTLLLYGAPIALVFVLRAPASLIPISFISILVAAILAVLMGVHRVTIYPHEIVTHHGILRSRHFAWADVVSIREVSRMDLLKQVTLTPHRCCSLGLSFRNNFRIETGTSYFLFPPSDVETFRVTVQTLWDEARTGTQSAP